MKSYTKLTPIDLSVIAIAAMSIVKHFKDIDFLPADPSFVLA